MLLNGIILNKFQNLIVLDHRKNVDVHENNPKRRQYLSEEKQQYDEIQIRVIILSFKFIHSLFWLKN